MLKPYEGAYYCEELDARYEIVLREGRLLLTSLRASDITLNPENRKTFISRSAGFPIISFSLTRREGDRIPGGVRIAASAGFPKNSCGRTLTPRLTNDLAMS